jgi:serine/threonine protein kinase/tetratricopeptide (TPR) repeat protein
MAVEGAQRSPNPSERIGKYEIVSKIGQGAMGEVYKGRDTVLDRFVAIKTMSAAVMGNPEMGQRFLREAQSAARLNHPNVVTLHDFGEDAGRFFMAMELLDGEDLSHTLKRGTLATLEDKLPIMEQVLDGVAYAHSSGVIHRDLKPANIHIQKNGHVKVMDFGLARLGESEITRAGTVMGTPNYMSPEQVRGEKTGPASDVFALGAMFYEVLSGRRAFDADSMHAVLFKVTESQPTPLAQVCEDIPPIIVTFIWRAIAKAPELRFKDAGQMREALDLCRRVFDGTLDEESAIGAMGEAATIVQTPGELASTAIWTDPDATQAPPSSPPSQRRSTVRPAPAPSLRPTSSPTIRRGGKTATRVAAPASTPPASVPATAPSRTPLLLGIGLIVAIAVVALVVLLRPQPQPAATDFKQAKAAFGVAVDAQLDAARKSLEYKDPEGAIAAAQKALQFDPGNAAAQDLVNKARALLDGVEADAREARRAADAGDLDGASRSLAKVLDVMPKHPVAAELSDRLASRFKAKADDAAKEMKKAAEAARRAGASSLRAYAEGVSYASQGDAAYARKQYTEAVQRYAEGRRAYEAADRDASDLAAKKAVAAKPADPAPVPAVVNTPLVLPATPPPTPAQVVQAPVAATPPPAAPPPTPKPVVDEEAAVRRVVVRLKEAIEQKDLSLYKRLRPNLKPDEEKRLRDAFQNVTSQQVEYSVESVSVEGNKATLRVTLSGRVSGQAIPSVKQVLKLSKTESGWVIDEIGQ